MRSRGGFTLVETLIVVVLLGLIVLIGFPKISSAMVRNDLRGARTTMINLVAAARAASVQSNRLTWVKIEGGTAYVIARPRLTVGGGALMFPCDTVGAVRDLAALYGVSVPGLDSIQFDPRGFGSGLGVGGSTSIVLSRGGYTSTITVDGLGRVVK